MILRGRSCARVQFYEDKSVDIRKNVLGTELLFSLNGPVLGVEAFMSTSIKC